MLRIPRSHRSARSRPLTLREGGVLIATIRSTPCHSERGTLSFRAERGIFPPSRSVRGARGDALVGVGQAASVELPASVWSPCGASPAHIASLVRAPLRFAKGAYACLLYVGWKRDLAVSLMDSGFRRNDECFLNDECCRNDVGCLHDVDCRNDVGCLVDGGFVGSCRDVFGAEFVS